MSKTLITVSFALIATSAVLWGVGLWAPADALMPLAVIIATNSAIALARSLQK
jgi:hypothetical protein